MSAAGNAYEKLELYIDGEWTSGTSGKAEDVINPATQEVLGVLPHASIADLDRALDAAKRGFETWRRMQAGERAKILKKAAELMRANAARIGRICTLEEGKVLGESIWEVMFTAERLEWLAEEGKRNNGHVLPPTPFGDQRMIVYEPVGPALGMSPWNMPCMMPFSKVANALAAGCSMILKPAEETPGTAVAIVRLFEEAGVPAGVLNLVFGVPGEVSSHLIASPIIKKVSFTGSVPVGKLLYGQCAPGMKKMTFELGGHSPVVIFDDADIDQAIAKTVPAKYSNAGQLCISPTRFYVHDAIADKFTEAFTARARALKVGNGLEDGVEMGPMANNRRMEAMETLISDARDKGAKVLTGGNRIGNRGFFYEPTVLADVPANARAMNEEPFGPVALINRWNDLDEVIEQSNALPFGLASYAFTRSQANARRIGEALEAGLIGINTAHVGGPDMPFGGVKESGVGRESGQEGLKEYYVSKILSTTPL